MIRRTNGYFRYFLRNLFVQKMEKHRQFGNRFLNDPRQVFEHNAWDDVAWDEEQEMEARKKVENNSKDLVRPDMMENLEVDADKYWDQFYGIHQNRFFKDRNWLFKEFPELLKDAQVATACAGCERSDDVTAMCVHTCAEKGSSDGQMYGGGSHHLSEDGAKDHASSEDILTDISNCDVDDNTAKIKCDITQSRVEPGTVSNSESEQAVIKNEGPSDSCKGEFPGHHADFRIFEVGCGVGNTVFPVLQTNNDQGVFVYCCDLSATAISLVKEHDLYDPTRCHAFVCDVTDLDSELPFPDNSLDVVTLIFVLSAVCPEKMQPAVERLARCLRPGGLLLFRDYGRYDMCQLRFKNGQCLSDNFYARQDGTRVYFFTQEELREMFTKAGLTEEQNIIDRRLQVNRGKQLKMYRVWMQCKYRKALKSGAAGEQVSHASDINNAIKTN